jgi:hypothetical protein
MNPAKYFAPIGSVLLATSCTEHTNGPDVPAAFHETMLSVRLGFQLLLAGTQLEGDDGARFGLTAAVLDDKVHATVNAMIERGIQARHLPCPHQWLLSEIGPADTGGVLFVGICVTPQETRAVEKDRLASTI